MRGSRRAASLLLPFFFRRPAVHLPLPAPSLLRQVPRRPWEPSNILDPGGDAVLRWNRIFLVSCLVALFVDPLYFYLLYIGGPGCVRFDFNIAVTVTFLRTIADFFYLGHMILKFRIAFSSRVFGRGELVRKPKLIAMRYLKGDFWIDLIAMLPIPQFIWTGFGHEPLHWRNIIRHSNMHCGSCSVFTFNWKYGDLLTVYNCET